MPFETAPSLKIYLFVNVFLIASVRPIAAQSLPLLLRSTSKCDVLTSLVVTRYFSLILNRMPSILSSTVLDYMFVPLTVSLPLFQSDAFICSLIDSSFNRAIPAYYDQRLGAILFSDRYLQLLLGYLYHGGQQLFLRRLPCSSCTSLSILGQDTP